MRIFYFITKSENGGAQTVVFELLRAHAKRGDTVTVMASGDGWLAEKTRGLGFAYVENACMQKTYNPVTLYSAAKIYQKAVRTFDPDLVSCHSSFSGLVGRVALFGRYPAVYTAHGWGFTSGVGFMRKAVAIAGEKFASYFCSRIICVSRFDAKNAERFAGIPSKKLEVIHNGITLDIQKEPRVFSETAEIVFNGRFAEPKRQDILLEAFALLPEAVQKKARITFIGGGVLEGAAKDQALRLGLAGKVNFLGTCSLEKAIAAMAAGDILALISKWEGFPIAILEGLQLGLPVVASNVGGVSEAVDDTVGRLVSNDAKEIAGVLEELITDIEKRKRVSLAAAVRGMEFTGTRMSASTFALYDEVIKEFSRSKVPSQASSR